MKLGIVLAGVLGRSIEYAELCGWAAANGYGAIDTPAGREDGPAIARAAGLELGAAQGSMQLLIADDAAREAAVAAAIERLDWAARTGHALVQIGHARAPDLSDEEQLRLARAGIGPVAAHAERLGLKLVMENYHAAGRNFAISPHNLRALFQAVPSPALGLCFDPSHLVVLGIDWLRALREFGSRIYYAHAKDTELHSEGLYQHGIASARFGQRPLGAGVEGWWRYTLPGLGVVEWGRYLGALREVGFDGILAVEHEDDAWGWRSDVPRTLEGLKLAERYLRPFLG